MHLSYAIVDCFLFFDGPVDLQILAPLTRIQCRLSDTQVTVKVRGSCNLENLFYFHLHVKAN